MFSSCFDIDFLFLLVSVPSIFCVAEWFTSFPFAEKAGNTSSVVGVGTEL